MESNVASLSGGFETMIFVKSDIFDSQITGIVRSEKSKFKRSHHLLAIWTISNMYGGHHVRTQCPSIERYIIGLRKDVRS